MPYNGALALCAAKAVERRRERERGSGQDWELLARRRRLRDGEKPKLTCPERAPEFVHVNFQAHRGCALSLQVTSKCSGQH